MTGTGFSGFPPEAIKFFSEIRLNNNRDWFQVNKSVYIEQVRDPAVEFVIDLGTRLQRLAPSIQFDTAVNGSGSLMRIYRDIRFSKDKTPYKTWMGIRFWEGNSYKTSPSGAYFGFSDEGAGFHVGSYSWTKEYLAAYQQAIDEQSRGSKLAQIFEDLSEGYTLNGEKYKRVPRGFPADHPRGELLKFKSLFASVEGISIPVITSPELVDVCVKHFEKLLPSP